MKIVKKLILSEVKLLEPDIYQDSRGYFFESFNKEKFDQIINEKINFVQDNQSHSKKNVLRGLHYQVNRPQGKLVRVVSGTVVDVAVDLRKSSPTFGVSVAVELSSKNNYMLWIPEGFAHGFIALSDDVSFLYKTTDYWFPEHERCIKWNDEKININWPKNISPVVSEKDINGVSFTKAELFS